MKISDLISAYPSLRGDAEYTDSDALADLKEWSEAAKAALAGALHDLEADNITLRNTTESQRGELDAIALQLDAAQMGRTLTIASQVEALRDDRDAQRGARRIAETRLSELHIAVRQALGAESVAEALEEARILRKVNAELGDKIAHFVAQRDEEVDQLRVGFMRQRDEAIKDRDFFKDQAERASEETRAQIDSLAACVTRAAALEAELADRDAQIEALGVETVHLEDQIDAIEESVGFNCWRGWDDVEGTEEDAIVRNVAHAPPRRSVAP